MIGGLCSPITSLRSLSGRSSSMLQIWLLNIDGLLCNARAFAPSISPCSDKPSEPAALSLQPIVYSCVTGVAALQSRHLTQKRKKSFFLFFFFCFLKDQRPKKKVKGKLLLWWWTESWISLWLLQGVEMLADVLQGLIISWPTVSVLESTPFTRLLLKTLVIKTSSQDYSH